MKSTILVLTCEHAVNWVPPEYLPLFHQHESVLKTHRAIDFGALDIAMHLNQTFACDFIHASVTRLLVDCNRSLTHPSCFSEFTSPLSPLEKQPLIDNYYLPYRLQAENVINGHIERGNQVLHLSIHSFTPIFNDITRNAGIGFLYDPKRHGEKEVARQWQKLLQEQTPLYRVRMNYPYQGASDGFTSALRKKHPEKDYLGLEVESNQDLVKDKASLNSLANALALSLKELLQLL